MTVLPETNIAEYRKRIQAIACPLCGARVYERCHRSSTRVYPNWHLERAVNAGVATAIGNKITYLELD